MGTGIILNQQSASLHRWYHRAGGTSMMARGNIVKEDQDFGTVESQKSLLLPLGITCHTPFICASSCTRFKTVSDV